MRENKRRGGDSLSLSKVEECGSECMGRGRDENTPHEATIQVTCEK